MTSIVLDASVAAKWLLPSAAEPLADEAFELLRRYVRAEIRFLVPDIFWPETANLLWKAARLGRCTKKAARQSLDSLVERKFPTAPSLPLLASAFSIAAEFDRTVYDSLYVALAIHARADFVTVDEKLANALAARLPVKWLSGLT